MNNEIETEKWKVFLKQPSEHPLDESYIELIFRLKSSLGSGNRIKQEDSEELEKDIKDLGKWRKFKELKRDLEK